MTTGFLKFIISRMSNATERQRNRRRAWNVHTVAEISAGTGLKRALDLPSLLQDGIWMIK
jgi:hypothetical protein